MFGSFSTARLRRASAFCAISGLALVASCSSDVRPSVDVGQTGGIQRIPAATFQETQEGTFEPAEAGSFAAQEPQYEPAVDAALADEFAMSTPEPDYGNEAPVRDEPDPGMNGGDPSEEYLSRPVEEQPQATVIRPLPQKRSWLAGFPRLTPRTEPSVSSEEAACRKELKRAGVRYEDIAPIRNGNTCYIDNPVKVSSIGNIQMKPAATLTCRMALTFAKWTNKELSPTARWKYFTGVKAIKQGSSYSCRRIAGSRTPSAHSTGNALDVMAIELNNGKTIDVKKQGLFSFRAKGLLNNVRADGCEYFSTVLGPGYNYDHRDHFHFDLMERKNGRRSCH